MKIQAFVHEGLGNSSYLVELPGQRAAIVDPDRSVARYLAAAEDRGLAISHVLETHLHADFITGAHELFAASAANILASATAELRLPHVALRHGQSMDLDGLRIEVLASPGHTPEHIAYVLRDANGPPALFSGGSLMAGGAARTDLIAPEQTEALTHAQFRTIHSAFSSLPDETILFPTHGGGSFCAAGAGGERTSTLALERATNPLLAMHDEDEFVQWFPTTFPAAPRYFFKLRPINQRGPQLSRQISPPAELEPAAFQIATGTAVVIDVRPQVEFMAGHVPGALSNTFRDAFTTWLGWLVPLDTPLLFVLGPEPRQRVLDECLLVGQERFVGVLHGGMEAWRAAGLPLADAGLADARAARDELLDGALALDVREPDEFATGHIEGALNIPLGSLQEQLARLDPLRPVVTYCGHGERSASALSMLQGAGFGELHNLNGGIDAWKEASYRVVAD